LKEAIVRLLDSGLGILESPCPKGVEDEGGVSRRMKLKERKESAESREKNLKFNRVSSIVQNATLDQAPDRESWKTLGTTDKC